MDILLISLGILLLSLISIVVLFLVFHFIVDAVNDMKWRKIMSDKYDQYNGNKV